MLTSISMPLVLNAYGISASFATKLVKSEHASFLLDLILIPVTLALLF